MCASRYHELVNGESRKIQDKGRLSLPKDWRDKHGIEPGDTVAVEETDDGTLEIVPPD